MYVRMSVWSACTCVCSLERTYVCVCVCMRIYVCVYTFGHTRIMNPLWNNRLFGADGLAPPRYAEELVKIMYAENAPDFGAASDGDHPKTLNPKPETRNPKPYTMIH